MPRTPVRPSIRYQYLSLISLQLAHPSYPRARTLASVEEVLAAANLEEAVQGAKASLEVPDQVLGLKINHMLILCCKGGMVHIRS